MCDSPLSWCEQVKTTKSWEHTRGSMEAMTAPGYSRCNPAITERMTSRGASACTWQQKGNNESNGFWEQCRFKPLARGSTSRPQICACYTGRGLQHLLLSKKKKEAGPRCFSLSGRVLCVRRGLGSELRPLMYSGVTTKTRCSSPGAAHYSPPECRRERTGAESWPRCSTGRSSCCHDDRWKTKVESSSLSSHLNPFARPAPFNDAIKRDAALSQGQKREIYQTQEKSDVLIFWLALEACGSELHLYHQTCFLLAAAPLSESCVFCSDSGFASSPALFLQWPCQEYTEKYRAAPVNLPATEDAVALTATQTFPGPVITVSFWKWHGAVKSINSPSYQTRLTGACNSERDGREHKLRT